MPYYDFIKREDVYGILKETLAYYFESSITVSDGYTLPQSSEEEVYLCFPRINAIIPSDFCNELKEYIKRDNRITYSFIRKSAMNAYLYGVFRYPRKLVDKSITISPAPQSCRDLLIYPGNKKIKIIHFRNKVIDNVLKKGFKGKWFTKELEIRGKPKWDFVLPLTLIKEGVYREELIVGYTYPRLDQKLKLSLIPRIKNCIEQIQSDVSDETINRYTTRLIEGIESGIKSVGDRVQRNKIEGLLSFVHSISKFMNDNSETLKLTFSHGDLQRGNILIQNNNNKLWILDWETWGVRSEYYDKMVFYYNMRNSNQMVKNIKLMFKDKGKMLSLPSIELSFLRDVTVIFLMEDIIWQLDETEVLSGRAVSNGLKHYMSPTRQRELFQLLEL